MAAKVNEVTDALGKNAALTKDKLDFEQRKNTLSSENNKSGNSLQGALIGAFSKNNPFAEALQQRLDFKQTNDDATTQKASNVIEGKKEIVDLTLQKAQLTLEQQGYENAITQTQLLADLVNVGQGREAKYIGTDAVQERLNSLPTLIQNSQQVAAQRLKFVDDKIAFVSKEVSSKNTNVDRERLSSQLKLLSNGGQFNPTNADLLTSTVSESTKSISNFKREEVSVGSLKDSSFQNDLAKMNALSSSLNPNYGLGRDVINQQSQASAQQYQQTQQPV
jgi:hypothetical protein